MAWFRVDALNDMITPIRGRWCCASCETVRHDLSLLACRAQERAVPNPVETRIARLVSGLIHGGETLLVSGTLLTRICAAHLRQMHLTILTNDLGLPALVPAAHNVYVLGAIRTDIAVDYRPCYAARVFRLRRLRPYQR
jgi:hypothetical protein